MTNQARRSTPSYILLEGFNAHAKTIQRYQKGKHVMAEPGFLDLRSDLGFGAGSREKILSAWGDGLRQLRVNIRHNAEVQARSPAPKGAFAIQLTSGETINAATVVLAIGLEGNPRKLGAPARIWSASNISSTIRRNSATKPSWWSAPAIRRSKTRWRWPSRTTSGS